MQLLCVLLSWVSFWILFFYYSSRHFQHNNNHIIHIIIVSCDQSYLRLLEGDIPIQKPLIKVTEDTRLPKGHLLPLLQPEDLVAQFPDLLD